LGPGRRNWEDNAIKRRTEKGLKEVGPGDQISRKVHKTIYRPERSEVPQMNNIHRNLSNKDIRDGKAVKIKRKRRILLSQGGRRKALKNRVGRGP